LSWIEAYAFPAFDILKTWFDTTFGVAFTIFDEDLLKLVTTPLLDLEKTLSDKVEQAFRRLVQFLEQTFGPVLKRLEANFIKPFGDAFTALLSPIQNVKNTIDDLVSSFSSLPGGVVSFVVDALPRNAKGALGQSGPFIAGEKGPELIIPSSRNQRSDIFPNSATMALQKMASMDSIMAQPANRYAYGGGGASQSVDNSRNTQMGGVTIQVNSPQEAMWMQQQMVARWNS
jgi:hypothetical protein